MQNIFKSLQQKTAEMKALLEKEIEDGKKKFSYAVSRKKVRFQPEAVKSQKKQRIGVVRYIFRARILAILTVPVIYSLLIPMVLLDLLATLYQRLCFPVYGIPRVKRSDHVIIDRQYLAYLNLIEKINCVYCGYGNGVLAYVSEIAARTEYFWCPVKHAKVPKKPHEFYHDFLEYGDAKNYPEGLQNLREKCRACKETGEDICKK